MSSFPWRGWGMAWRVGRLRACEAMSGAAGGRRATANRPHPVAFPLCGPRAPQSCGAVFFSQPAREGKAAASYKRGAGGGAGKWAVLGAKRSRVPACRADKSREGAHRCCAHAKGVNTRRLRSTRVRHVTHATCVDNRARNERFGRATRCLLSSLKMVVRSVIARRLGLRLMRSSRKTRAGRVLKRER